MTMNDGNKDLELTEGLREYVSTSLYRRALKLPDNLEEEYHLLAQGEYNRKALYSFMGRGSGNGEVHSSACSPRRCIFRGADCGYKGCGKPSACGNLRHGVRDRSHEAIHRDS